MPAVSLLKLSASSHEVAPDSGHRKKAPVASRTSRDSATVGKPPSTSALGSWVGNRTNRRNRKGRDIGYALAAGSCEEANSVEACTVTAPDAITAFAVPNLNYPSQGSRFVQVWLPQRVTPPS
jgi:hypothetical protein